MASYRSALELRPGFADGHFNLGNALDDLGRYEAAVASYRSALALKPGFAEAHNNLGSALSHLERHEEAIASCRSALALRPGFAEAHNNLGRALNDLKRYDEAIGSCRSALALKPDFAEAYSNLGSALNNLKRHEEAIASCRQALAIQPGLAEAHSNLGAALSAVDRHEEAIASCQRALAIKPELADAHNNLGNALNACNRHEEAIAIYQRALALQPDLAEAHLNQSFALLAIGDFEHAWKEYEWRWLTREFERLPKFKQQPWRGAGDLSGKRILLHNEQGFGDTLQFVRYVPLVAARGARVVLEVQRPLKALAGSVAGVDEVVAEGEALPGFDYQCPLLSLPLAFGTTLQSIPGEVPYLHPAPDRVAKWRALLGERTGLRIGLAWSGNRNQKNDHNRSIGLARLLPLLSVPGVRFVGLQKELREEDVEVLGKVPGFTHLGEQLEDFADTAAAVSLLDLVITVDSAVAHLAGALGRPVWVLLPFAADWRWLLEREDSPWYPSARLFRQPKIGDWDSVIARLREELPRLASDLSARSDTQAPSAQSARMPLRMEDSAARAVPAPDHARLLEQALACFRRGDTAQAEKFYLAVLRDDDGHFNALHLLGVLRAQQGRHHEAIDLMTRALERNPASAEAHGNLGNALYELDRHEQAVASCLRAIAIKPDFQEAHYNLGNALHALNRHREAIASYDRALALKPDDVESRWNRSLSLLAVGDFERAWKEYEWRWLTREFERLPKFKQQPWLGSKDLAGKTILLRAEQGLGDALQFVRYASLLAAKRARVVLQVPAALKPLCIDAAGVDEVVAEGEALPGFDYQCPLLSLPLAFGTTLQSIPGEVPYLHPAPDRVAKWRALLGERTGLRVGLAWQGNRQHKNDRNRSIGLARLLPLLSVPGVRFVGLQKELREEDVEVLGKVPGFTHLGEQLEDFADTAAAVSLLDLVITVDSAVAHLAGALGRPVWVLLPFAADWRWLLEREDSPWYPSARLFRQPKIGDWDSVIARLREELLHLSRQGR